jgi:F-type H+-transporting ATPase subunit epsilon
MATPFLAELVTPERVLFSGEVEEVSLRTDEGEIAFLAKHEDFIAAVDITVCRFTPVTSGEATPPILAAIHGGFVHVDQSGVKLLAGVAELGSEVDVARARAALANAESRQGGDATGGHVDEASAEAGNGVARSGAMLALLEPDAPEQAVRRAKTRLEAAGEPVQS